MNNGYELNIVKAIFKKSTPFLRDSAYSSYRSGLSTVLTGLIMLTAVSVMGTTGVYWSQSNLNAREHATGSLYSNIINQVKESLVVEHFWYDTHKQNLNIVLKNTGKDGLSVFQIEIDGPTRQITHISNGGIVPNGMYTAIVHYYWLGDPLDVYVTTNRSSIFHFRLVSPTDGTLIIQKVSKLGNGNFSFNGDLGKFNVNTTGWSTGANLLPNGSLVMSGVIRDFNGSDHRGGNPDFEKKCCPPAYGVYKNIVLPNLGVDHEPVYNNQTTSPWNSGFVNFNQWYHDSPMSMKKNLNITLNKLPSNPPNPTTWTYNDTSFFPIDKQLFCQGNSTCSEKGVGGIWHNFGFTYEVHSSFTYQGGETFYFSGDDDVWVFINHKLAIDIGGVHALNKTSLYLDPQASNLGITKGGTYDFDFFYAERHTVSSDMEITTSIQLGQNGVGTTSAFFVDPGKYTINELVPNGWTLIGRQCDNGYTLPNSTEITITVPKGVTTCTFTNTK